MESFYGCLEPRNAPNPTSFIKNTTNTQIPDVSMVFDKSNTNSINIRDKENLPFENVMKKQIRFQPAPLSTNYSFNTQPLFDFKNFGNIEKHVSNDKHKLEKPIQLLNNELDLSVYDNKNQTNSHFTTNQKMFDNKNFKSYGDWVNHINSQPKITEIKNQDPKPTISDLYEIVKNQNNRLESLQKQVESLLDQNATLNDKKSVNSISSTECHCKCYNKSVKDIETNTSLHSNPIQVSIGVMTSFEINVNTNHNDQNIIHKNTTTPNQKCLEIQKTPTRVQNKHFSNMSCNFNSNLINTITEGYSRCKEYSLSEIPEIPEHLEDTIISSNSIHVDMQEFPESSDDEENDSSNENSEEYNIGWAVYNNVVEHVQNILETSPREKTNESIENIKRFEFPNQIQDLGVNFANLNIAKDSNFINKNRMRPNDLSVEVNQLVMKYLRDDQLSFLLTKNQKTQKISSQGRNQFQKQNILFQSPSKGNEMSFATVKYMQKYRLWNQSTDQVACNVQQMIKTQEYRPSSKLLDMTALRQQPKLL